MTDHEEDIEGIGGHEHQAVYLFEEPGDAAEKSRPQKRRKLTANGSSATIPVAAPPLFVPLFHGLEKAESVGCRERLFHLATSRAMQHAYAVLRDSNQATVSNIESFVNEARADSEKVPAGFIILGPNAASEEILFKQLSERLSQNGTSIVVHLQSAEISNLKAALKKIIRDGSSNAARSGEEGADEEEVAMAQDGRKYLNYDLEALHVVTKAQNIAQIIVVFQDCEGFGASLLSDLVSLFYSWRDRIRFTLLFGVATSVELLQARLPKLITRHLRGRQFDVVQQDTVLDSMFKAVVAASGEALQLGQGLLQTFVERLRVHMGGIQAFISSLKYAYMCHFWANPLSVFLDQVDAVREMLQSEHLEALRALPSFKAHVESAVEAGDLDHALSLLNDDQYLLDHVFEQLEDRRANELRTLRSLSLLMAVGASIKRFTDLYLDAIAHGIDPGAEGSSLLSSVRLMQPDELLGLSTRLATVVTGGSPEMSLTGWASEAEPLVSFLDEIVDKVALLQTRAKRAGHVLRSGHATQGKVLRTTVVAQKVQLSQDTAALTAEDKEFTELVDRLVELLKTHIGCEAPASMVFHEIWLYDGKAPYRDVFVPRPSIAFERALLQPHDYLACNCCDTSESGLAPTSPSTAIVYHLYTEAGSYINVTDLWASFNGIVGDSDETEETDRAALMRFYRALAELKGMGYVKQTRKKVDHVAKVKWL